MKFRSLLSNGVRVSALLFAIGLVIGLVACASKQEQLSCAQMDWYELGRRDGGEGAALSKLADHQKECSGQIQADSKTIYLNGRNAGLVEYCSADNGFELGRSGLAYNSVCPSTMETQFVQSYHRGLKVHEIEVNNKAIEAKIDQVSRKLIQVASDTERTRLSEELAQLQKVKLRNQRQLTQISN